MLELHVLGPAFSLPSIDAHCLAAVAYLSQAVPKDSWRLIASPNPAAELPALRDGDAYVTGFDRIVRYLRETSGGEWDLDADLDDEGRADVAA
jgi:sorting and assembly machinery component 37